MSASNPQTITINLSGADHQRAHNVAVGRGFASIHEMLTAVLSQAVQLDEQNAAARSFAQTWTPITPL